MSRRRRFTIAQLNAEIVATVGVERYVEWLYGRKLPRLADTLRAGSIDGDEGSSFSIVVNGPYAGRWREFDGKAGGPDRGDLIDLTAHVFRVDLTEAARIARDFLGGKPKAPPPRRSSPAAAPAADPTRNARIAASLWSQRQPITGTPAETYLARRGLRAPDGAQLGFLETAKYPKPGAVFPALIGAFQNLAGEVTGILRIFLTHDGAKAPVPEPKLMLGTTQGCAVRLGPAAPTLALCEGIETGLAYMALNPGKIAWALGAARGFLSVQLPETVSQVELLGELAPTGEPDPTSAHYTAAALARFRAEGRSARVEYPEVPKDHNDELLYRLKMTGFQIAKPQNID